MDPFDFYGVNQGLVEELYLKYCENPLSVAESWRHFFEGLPARATTPGFVLAPPPALSELYGNGSGSGSAEPGGAPPNGNGNGHARASVNGAPSSEPPDGSLESWTPRHLSVPPTSVDRATTLQGRVSALINAYRARGHLFATLDPLGLATRAAEELTLAGFGLRESDLDTVFATDFPNVDRLTLREIIARLESTYCRTIGVEFSFIEEPNERNWLQERMEATGNRVVLTREEEIRVLAKLTDAELFETFIHTNYVGAKRFSVEGGESFIPLMDLLIENAAERGVDEIVMGMAHRGRLNVLANILGKSLKEIFAHFEDSHPELNLGRGDVKYHLGYSCDRVTSTGKNVHLSLTFNPSHLEFVNPVVEGRVRAKQDRKGDANRKRVLPLLVHGDAAFVGQGIVAETLNLANLRGYATGGTIHVVINNQVGFTTATEDARSTRYCTDITRMLRCPIFHVNGEDPEAVVQVAQLATEYRQQFGKDVVIDLYCYRKYGHNEADEPRYTQPRMYAAIDKKPTVREVYVRRLVASGQIDESKAREIAEARRVALEEALAQAKKKDFVPPMYALSGAWNGYVGGPDANVPDVDTTVPRETLVEMLHKLTTVPRGFHLNKGIARTVLEKRAKAIEPKAPVDWGTAEHLAYATLLSRGTRVRISGQDARRGTFSHRHATFFDTETGETYTPLANVSPQQGPLEIYDSPLSEQGVLGFDYGYSLDYPEALVVWEAQFGDFGNGAQVIIDQFITSSEDKWMRLSGLVLLLPHGFEGQGPEHSSARLERFLTLAAEDNIQVVNLTTAAQVFHCLRRQVLRPWRKPLVVMSPKSLLREPRAATTLDELATGGFQRIIPDTSGTDPKKVKRVLLCSGKVYYDLAASRDERKATDVHVIRLEQLYPLRAAEVEAVLAPYAKNTKLVWVQEEPENNGALRYVLARLEPMVEARFGRLRMVSRLESASPATGSNASHKLEQRQLIEEAFTAV